RRHTRCYRDWSSDVCSSDLFDVLVQLVIAAITTEPWRSWCAAPSSVRSTCVRRCGGASTAVSTPPPPPSPSHRPMFWGGAIGERSEERRVGKGGSCVGWAEA